MIRERKINVRNVENTARLSADSNQILVIKSWWCRDRRHTLWQELEEMRMDADHKPLRRTHSSNVT